MAWLYAHIALCSAHQYLALCRARHRVTVEVELRHTYAWQETATYDLQSPCVALSLYAYNATARGAYPVGPIAIAPHTFGYIASAPDVAQRVALGVVNRHSVRVQQHDYSLLPVSHHVGHHLVQPLLRVAFVAECHAALVAFQVVVPQSIHRSQQHGASTIVAYGIGTNVVTVGSHCACALILGVEYHCLANGRRRPYTSLIVGSQRPYIFRRECAQVYCIPLPVCCIRQMIQALVIRACPHAALSVACQAHHREVRQRRLQGATVFVLYIHAVAISTHP